MVSRKIVLNFPEKIANQPIVYKLVKDFDLGFNILKAYITPEEGGRLVLEVSGAAKNYKRGMQYLTESGVEMQPLSQDIIRNENRCSHCGVCVPLCPAGAFTVESSTREVRFEDSMCIACCLCVKICPVRAMEVKF